jgi:hypothetical protein
LASPLRLGELNYSDKVWALGEIICLQAKTLSGFQNEIFIHEGNIYETNTKFIKCAIFCAFAW